MLSGLVLLSGVWSVTFPSALSRCHPGYLLLAAYFAQFFSLCPVCWADSFAALLSAAVSVTKTTWVSEWGGSYCITLLCEVAKQAYCCSPWIWETFVWFLVLYNKALIHLFQTKMFQPFWLELIPQSPKNYCWRYFFVGFTPTYHFYSSQFPFFDQ